MTIQIERGPVNDDPKFKNNCKDFWFEFCVILQEEKMTTCLSLLFFLNILNTQTRRK